MVSQETLSLNGAVLIFLKLIMPRIVKGTTVFSYTVFTTSEISLLYYC